MSENSLQEMVDSIICKKLNLVSLSSEELDNLINVMEEALNSNLLLDDIEIDMIWAFGIVRREIDNRRVRG